MSEADIDRNRALVNDHAVIRFLERVYGLDVERIRAEIVAATARGRAVGEIMDAPEFAIAIERVRFVVARGHVVTTLGPGMRFNPSSRMRRR